MLDHDLSQDLPVTITAFTGRKPYKVSQLSPPQLYVYHYFCFRDKLMSC